MTSVPEAGWRSRFQLGRIGCVVCALLSSQLSAIAQSESFHWATGVEFQRQLAAPVGVTWGGVPLRDALTRLSQESRVAIFLDRRVDPNLRISLQSKGASLGRVLAGLAKRLNLGTAEVGPVVYLGPHFTADRLTTLAVKRNEETSQLPEPQAGAWRKRVAWSWPRLSQPQQLLSQLATENELTIKNPQRIPHDLWPGVSLPPLTLAERLTLFLAGFQMSYSFDEQSNILLTKLPTAVFIERRYRLRDKALVDRLGKLFPQAEIEVVENEVAGETLVVRSTVADQQAIQKIVSGEKPGIAAKNSDSTAADVDTPPVDLERKRFRLRIVNRKFHPLLSELAQSLELKLEFSDDVSVDDKQLISVEVQDATIDELMEAVLEPVNLIHQRDGKRLQIRPKSKTAD